MCKEEIRDESGSHVTLTEKGAIGVCSASKERHDELIVTAGEKVHKSCRDSYVNKKNIKSYNKKRESACHDGSPVKHRSTELLFLLVTDLLQLFSHEAFKSKNLEI